MEVCVTELLQNNNFTTNRIVNEVKLFSPSLGKDPGIFLLEKYSIIYYGYLGLYLKDGRY